MFVVFEVTCDMNVQTVVMIHDEAEISGGSSRIAIESAVELKARGVNVIYVTGIGLPCIELKKAGIRTVCLGEEHIASTRNIVSILKGLWNPHAYRVLRKLLRSLDNKCTVVHIHGWTKSLSASVFWACFKERFHVVTTVHDYFPICQNGGLYNYKLNQNCSMIPGSWKCFLCNCDKRNYFNKLYRNARQLIQSKILRKTNPAIIFVSSFSKKLMEPYINCSSKTYQLTNFVDAAVHERVCAENNDIFMFIGRISEEKGIDLFCKAITRTNSYGVVIGDGINKELFAKQYPNIKFVGWKTKKEMELYIEKARALIVTSRLHETMGLTVAEMQSYGVPCIVPHECAACEFVDDKRTGWLYSINNKNELLVAIRRFQDDDLVCRLSKNYYEKAGTSYYSINTYIDKLIVIYNEILKRDRRQL